jgi:CBS domain containing-hemolysin-like protein
LYVDEGTDILDLLQQFKSSPVHFAIVVSKQGTIRGIATPMDVLEAMVGHMPSGDLHPSEVRQPPEWRRLGTATGAMEWGSCRRVAAVSLEDPSRRPKWCGTPDVPNG